MGTSTWHRSPDTEQWRRVRELYERPDADPAEVARRIVEALDPATTAAMSGPAVVTCLGTVLEGCHRVATAGLSSTLDDLGVGREPPAIQVAAGLRNRAEELIADQAQASRFGDLALEAVGTTSLTIATLRAPDTGLMEMPLAVAEDSFAHFEREGRLHEVASLFVGHDIDRAFRYFVARDVGDYIGRDGLPTVSDASRLEDAVAAHCRSAWTAIDVADREELLLGAADGPPSERVARLQPVMAAGLDQGLTLLGGRGAPS